MRPVCILLFFLPLWSFTPSMQWEERPGKVENYIQKFRYLAVELNEQTGIPIPIIFAVAGLESDWGTSELAIMSNNHFGIKANNWKGPFYCKNTMEFYGGVPYRHEDCFRKYTFIRDSYFDFGRFLRSRAHYANLFQLSQDDYTNWAFGLSRSCYATDPDYPNKILRVIFEYGLHEEE